MADAAPTPLRRFLPRRSARATPGARVRTSALAALVPRIDVNGPRVRLGVAWAVVSTIAVAAGPLIASVGFAAVALAASGQACRSWRGRDRRPYVPVAVGGATIAALAGSAGPPAFGAAVALTLVAAVVASRFRFGRRSWDARVTIAIAVLVGAAAATPALVRAELGAVPALVLLGLVHAVDASAFIVGSGAASRWEGPVAGAATAAAVSLFVAALFVPPFRGAAPWVLGGLAAVGVPAGAMAASLLVGRAEAPVPALRRLDAWVVVGPLWALAASLLLD